MSILDRIDEFLTREQKRLRKRDPKRCLKENFDMDDLLDKMGNFIYNLDPNVLDMEGKRIREEILAAFEPPFELTDREWNFDDTHLSDDTSELDTMEDDEVVDNTIADEDAELEDKVYEENEVKKKRMTIDGITTTTHIKERKKRNLQKKK
ncbi:MAG TPA: hypothetical protein P5293_05040 [Bacteroidales bacterium]|nr:hypothetical protein [Bacteroidales bacterium]